MQREYVCPAKKAGLIAIWGYNYFIKQAALRIEGVSTLRDYGQLTVNLRQELR